MSKKQPTRAGKNLKGDYEVGRCRPPLRTRFKPGVSGNPMGRPAGRPNAKTTLARVMNETVPVREGEKTRSMTKLEAMLQAHAMKAIKGDPRSANIFIGLVARMGLLGETETDMSADVSREDAAILDDYLRRKTGTANNEPSDNSEKH
jgi:hypothetical protein